MCLVLLSLILGRWGVLRNGRILVMEGDNFEMRVDTSLRTMLLTSQGLPQLQHLIYPRLSTEFIMLVFFTNLNLLFAVIDSFFHLMHAIAHAHQHTCHQFDACKKQHTSLLLMTLFVWDIGTKKRKERTKTSDVIVDHFSLIFVSFLLA